ncbi:MAG: zinc ribbon domain-containing protein [Candidatus Margulisiibacteriota bacterium]
MPNNNKCQSCSMPLSKNKDYGTNADNSPNKEYCRFCFQKGVFTEPNISFDEMMDKVAHVMIAKVAVPEEKAYEIARLELTQVSRWK